MTSNEILQKAFSLLNKKVYPNSLDKIVPSKRTERWCNFQLYSTLISISKSATDNEILAIVQIHTVVFPEEQGPCEVSVSQYSLTEDELEDLCMNYSEFMPDDSTILDQAARLVGDLSAYSQSSKVPIPTMLGTMVLDVILNRLEKNHSTISENNRSAIFQKLYNALCLNFAHQACGHKTDSPHYNSGAMEVIKEQLAVLRK